MRVGCIYSVTTDLQGDRSFRHLQALDTFVAK